MLTIDGAGSMQAESSKQKIGINPDSYFQLSTKIMSSSTPY